MPKFCPVYKTLQLLQARWTCVILRDLFAGITRFNDFLRATPQLTPRVLSQRLEELESNGLVKRKVLTDRPLKVEYHLTHKGKKLKKVISAMRDFGKHYC